MNNTCYQTLDKNFKEALNLIEKPLTHHELVEFLDSGNIPQKQLAALELDTLYSTDEAQILLENLVGQDGKIREAVSVKIKEFMCDKGLVDFFVMKNPGHAAELFIEAITDINGNICRNIIDAVSTLRKNNGFSKIFIELLIKRIFDLIRKIKGFNFKERKYKINKEVFKLYWTLEALNVFYDTVDIQQLKQILFLTKDMEDYTIREKTAKILSNNFQDSGLQSIRVQLKNDKNYYVRRL